MPEYEVTMRGESREVYALSAETEDEAREFWYTGQLVQSENTDMDVYKVEEVDA